MLCRINFRHDFTEKQQKESQYNGDNQKFQNDFLLRHEIGGWFTENDEVALMVAHLILPFIIYQFGDGMQCTYANALRGIADVKPAMYIAFIAYFIISLPAGYFFGFVFDWGLTGIWLSFPFGLTSAGLMFWLRFRKQVG